MNEREKRLQRHMKAFRALNLEAADLLERWWRAAQTASDDRTVVNDTAAVILRLRAVLPQDEPTP